MSQISPSVVEWVTCLPGTMFNLGSSLGQGETWMITILGVVYSDKVLRINWCIKVHKCGLKTQLLFCL